MGGPGKRRTIRKHNGIFGIRSRSSLSAKGEAEKERWVLFGNYLRNLQEYGELGAAKEIFNRYFSYAVALGVVA